MDWWHLVQQLGFKFDPTDVQLILFYLYPKFRGCKGSCDLIGSSDQVYKKPPWELCTDLTAFPGGEKYYFFTKLEKNKDRVVRTVGPYGKWHESTSKEISAGSGFSNINNNNNGIIGFKKLFNFQEKGKGKKMKTTDWLMHEFSLPDKKNNLVLCVIQKNKKKKEEMGSASAGGDPSPAPANVDHFEMQAFYSEEEGTQPSKKMRSDTKSDDDLFSVASSSIDFTTDFMRILEIIKDCIEIGKQ